MEIAKETTIAFTGNRTLTSPNVKHALALKMKICDLLYATLEREYLENGYNTYLCGMALGFDTIAALVTTQLKRKYKDIRLIAVIPFVGQESKFSDHDKSVYKHLLAGADSVVVVSSDEYSNKEPNNPSSTQINTPSNAPTHAAYHKRNDFLIANSSKIIAYHNGKPRSGTASTIRKAMEQGITVVNQFNRI